MLVNKIRLENFQSHEYTEIDLSPGLTVIIGESDRGKSAVIRALRWLFLNEPKGSDFIRAGASGCRVTAVFDDGTEVTRERGRNKNCYAVVCPDGRREVYEGFGADIPAEVTGLHGICKVRLDDGLEVSLNFALQLDSPFLLSGPGSTKAKAIGRLHGVHIVDAAVRAAMRDITRLQQEEKRLEEYLVSLDEKLKEFAGLPALQVKLLHCSSLAEQISKMRERAAVLSRLRQNLAGTRAEISIAGDRLDSLRQLPRAEEMAADLEYAYRRAEKLAGLKNRLDVNRREASRNRHEIALTGKIDDGRNFLSDAEKKYQRYRSLAALQEKAVAVSGERTLQTRIVAATDCLSRAAAKMEELAGLRLKLEKAELLNCKLGTVRKEIPAGRFVLAATGGIEKAFSVIEVLSALPGKVDRLASIRNNLFSTRQRLEKGRNFYRENELLLTGMAREYGAALKKLGRCPACFREVDQSTIERILKEVVGGNGL
jgi:exonuclease SbcC